MDHPYRYEVSSFDGVCEEGVAPQRMIVEKNYDVIAIRMAWFNCGYQPQCDDLAKTIGLKK